MEKQIKIRDFRHKQFFIMDDEYMNGYARACGWQATLAYNSLCRHANKDQYAFPSIKLMAEENGVSRDTILRGIKNLEKWNVVRISKQRTEGGIYKNNGYDLIDKSEWKPKPSRPQRHGQPSRPQQPDQVAHSDLTKSPTATIRKHISRKHISRVNTPTLKKKKFSSLKDITPDDIQEIAEKYKVNPGFVNLQFEKLKNYCESKGRRYKNYKSALRNFVLGDMQRSIERSGENDKKRGIDATNL